jgi:predicted nucleotidyltransferase
LWYNPLMNYTSSDKPVPESIAASLARSEAQIAAGQTVPLQPVLDRLRFSIAGLPGTTVKPPLDADTERAARVFMKRIEGVYPAIDGLVFGSRARGTHTADSDADLAVILKGEHGDRYKVAGDMAGIAFDVMLETGVRIDPLPLWEDELQRPDLFSNPVLIENIKREGLRF